MDTPGFKALPPEFVGYDNLISFIEQQALMKLEGDLVEIGAYMGGGTVKLATLASQYGKRLFVIDTFDPTMDKTISRSAVPACEVYQAFLQGQSMWEVYREATRHFCNIITIREDSKRIRFCGERFSFGFVDGCHAKDCVENDFGLIWPCLVPGGVIGLHDYQFDDWPEVTEAIMELMDWHKEEIADTYELPGSYGIKSIFLRKK
jgi:hypothetical protein